MKITHGMKVSAAALLLGALVVGAFALSATVEVNAGQLKVSVCHVINIPEEGNGHVNWIADPAWYAHRELGDKKIEEGAADDGDGTSHLVTAPIAVDDEVTTPVNTPVMIGVLANDSYVDLVVVSVQKSPQSGLLGILGVGVFQYTPNAGFAGTDSFTYKITEAGGLSSDTATVTITVGQWLAYDQRKFRTT